MKTSHARIQPALIIAFALLAVLPLGAQQHRATRLGNPETRFAPPLTSPRQLRVLLTSDEMRADVESILAQGGYRGDVADFRRAAASNEIYEIRIHPGTIMPYMSSRKQGRPVALKEVLWAGKEPVEAYAFLFTSRGQRYRCVTPKPCSNFFTEELGPEPPPVLGLSKFAPASVSRCSPFEVTLVVTNAGRVPLTQVRVTDELPPGLKAVGDEPATAWDAGTLAPGASREFRFQVQAESVGDFANRARATSAEGGRAEAVATTTVRAPRLTLECETLKTVLLGRPLDVCLTVRNTGDATEPRAVARLQLPEGSKVAGVSEGGVASPVDVIWELGDLAPGAAKVCCATLRAVDTGEFFVQSSVTGTCAPPAESACAAQVAGIPAILLEVVDVEDPVPVGERVTYQIRVTNQGSATGTNVRIACVLPATQEFVSGSGVTECNASGQTVTFEPLAVLAPKGQAEWQVVVKATGVGDARFEVKLSSDQFAKPIEEIESTTQY
jgi:uncharacterized repeat protein (TIGR01451 family)